MSVESQAEHNWIITSSRFYSFGLNRTPITFLQKYYKESAGQYKNIKRNKNYRGHARKK
jgi:hypothetical protein